MRIFRAKKDVFVAASRRRQSQEWGSLWIFKKDLVVIVIEDFHPGCICMYPCGRVVELGERICADEFFQEIS